MESEDIFKVLESSFSKWVRDSGLSETYRNEKNEEMCFNSPLSKIFYSYFHIVSGKSELTNGSLAFTAFIRPEEKFSFSGKNYYVDFVVYLQDTKRLKDPRRVALIELDGFSFHNRDKKQFEYERERQNNLMTLNLPIFRFTYSDLTQRLNESISFLLESIESNELDSLLESYRLVMGDA